MHIYHKQSTGCLEKQLFNNFKLIKIFRFIKSFNKKKEYILKMSGLGQLYDNCF